MKTAHLSGRMPAVYSVSINLTLQLINDFNSDAPRELAMSPALLDMYVEALPVWRNTHKRGTFVLVLDRDFIIADGIAMLPLPGYYKHELITAFNGQIKGAYADAKQILFIDRSGMIEVFNKYLERACDAIANDLNPAPCSNESESND